MKSKSKKKSLIDRPKELLELIGDLLKPKQEEKQKFGEVFTPLNLITNLLNKLPKKIWKNPDLKWFDPAGGMGNFQIIIYQKLMKGLTKIILDEKERKKHILENMIYYAEINQKNVFIYKQIFDVKNEFKLNVYHGDTLILDIEDYFKIKKFDIIVGNPPYNSGGIRSHTGKRLGEKNITLWPKFVELVFSCSVKNGYLVFITPLSWLKLSHSCHQLLCKKQVKWLELWDNSKSKSEINADIPISQYCLKNVNNMKKKKTTIKIISTRGKISKIDKVYLNPDYSIPLAYHTIFEKIRVFLEENPEFKIDVKTKTVKSEGKQTKILKKIERKDLWGIDTYRLKDGYFVKKMKEKHPDMNKPKLIIANKCSFAGCLIDKKGKLGLTGSDKSYILGDKFEILKQFLEKTKICYIISRYTKYRQDFLEKDAFQYIIDVRKIPKKKLSEISDEGIGKLIGLDDEEMKELYVKKSKK
jgi:hypothetical protein